MTGARLIAITCVAASMTACGSRVVVPTRTGPVPTTVTYALESVGETMGLHRDPAIAALIADIDPAHIGHTD